MAAHCGALVIRSDRCLIQLVRSFGTGRVAAVTAWSSTLLGPEGTGAEPSLKDRPAPPWIRRCADPDRPYLENCTVDASIKCSRQANNGTRWMPRSEEHTSELQSRLHLVCRLL